MSTSITVNGVVGLTCTLAVPNVGAWVASVDFADAPIMSGAVSLVLNGVILKGTIDPERSGSFQLGRKVRIIGGGGGWGTQLEAKQYHNDAGIKPSHILNDVAGSAGETIVVADDTRIGSDFIRSPGPASRVLRQLGQAWWVDYAGVTQTGPHPTADATGYDLLHYDPRNHVAELAVDDISKVVVGSVLRGRLDAPLTVRELEVRIDKDKSRMFVWGST